MGMSRRSWPFRPMRIGNVWVRQQIMPQQSGNKQSKTPKANSMPSHKCLHVYSKPKPWTTIQKKLRKYNVALQMGYKGIPGKF